MNYSVSLDPIGMGRRVLGKSVTMTVINPWGFVSAQQAIIEMAVKVAQKSAIYMAQSLEQYFRSAYPGSAGTNFLTELTQQAFQMTELLVERGLARELSKYFMFRLSPQKLSKSFNKIRDNRLTGSGPIMETHGNQLITYSYTGTMGNMRPAISALRFPELTPAWHYLQLFEQFFLKQNGDLVFILNDEVVVGRFDSFSYDVDANNPYIINYKFSVSIYPDTKFSLLSGGVGQAFKVIKPVQGGSPYRDLSPTSSAIDVFEDTYGDALLNEIETYALPNLS